MRKIRSERNRLRDRSCHGDEVFKTVIQNINDEMKESKGGKRYSKGVVNRDKSISPERKLRRTEQVNRNKIAENSKNNNATLAENSVFMDNSVTEDKCIQNDNIVDCVDKRIVRHDGVVVDIGYAEEDDFVSDYESDENSGAQSLSENERENGGDVTDQDTEQAESSLDKMRKDPNLIKLVEEMLEEKLQQREVSRSERGETSRAQSIEETSTPTKQGGMEINVTPLVKGRGEANMMIVESPSDTTLYTPALQKKYIADKLPNESNMQSRPRQQLLINNINESGTIVAQDNAVPLVDDMTINQISDFVESIRMEGQQQRSEVTVPGCKEARERTNKAILDTEKFKAQVADPPGKSLNSVNVDDMFEQMMGDRTMKQSQSGRSDDDFIT